MSTPIQTADAAAVMSKILRSAPKSASKNIHGILNQPELPHELKAGLATVVNDYLEVQDHGGRQAPFEAKKDVGDLAGHYKLDKTDLQVLDQYRDDLIVKGVLEKMGSDEGREPEPITMADEIEAALAVHGFKED